MRHSHLLAGTLPEDCEITLKRNTDELLASDAMKHTVCEMLDGNEFPDLSTEDREKATTILNDDLKPIWTDNPDDNNDEAVKNFKFLYQTFEGLPASQKEFQAAASGLQLDDE